MIKSLTILQSIMLYGLVLSLFSACTNAKQAVEQQQRNEMPNIVLVVSDDQGYGDIACLGNPWVNTPNMDALHKVSDRLTNFHVSPTCAPTRSSLMTGRSANRTGVWHTVGGRSLLRENELTIAQVLKEAGYDTGIFGKWHLGDSYPYRPQDKGFTEVLVHGAGGVGQQPDAWGNDYFDDTYFHNGKPEKFEGYCTDVWFDNAMSFIKASKQKKKPFFCYLATNAPHGPFNVAKKYEAPYKDNENIPVPAFYGMITNLDDNLGELMKFMKTEGLDENTIFIFMTDNGTAAGMWSDKNGLAKKGFNAGMRGHKGSMYEGGHRVPFFIKWPKGGIGTGKDINELTAAVDLFPTLLNLTGVQAPKDAPDVDGADISTLIKTGKDASLAKRILITDSQRLENCVKWRQSATMQGDWRLVNGKELYNIASDPGQQKDVAAEHPALVKELTNGYEKWWASLEEGFKNTPHIPLCPTEAPITELFSHDMHADGLKGKKDGKVYVWNQNQVRSGASATGWWSVEALEAGQYTFTASRWPIELAVPITGTVPAIPGPEGTTVKGYAAGKAVNFIKAGIAIGEERVVEDIEQDAATVTFTVDVPKGKHHLRLWFEDDQQQEAGALYIHVKKAL